MKRNLFEVLESWDPGKSTIVVSQFLVTSWYDLFQEYAYADSYLNRLLHNSYRLEMNGKNMRNLKPTNLCQEPQKKQPNFTPPSPKHPHRSSETGTPVKQNEQFVKENDPKKMIKKLRSGDLSFLLDYTADMD